MSVTARGGYQIADFKNTACIAGESYTIPGIWEQVKNGDKKPVLVCNFVIAYSGSTATDIILPTFAPAMPVSGSEEIHLYIMQGSYGYEITVTSEDAVSFSELELTANE